jgi:hypothetical protein
MTSCSVYNNPENRVIKFFRNIGSLQYTKAHGVTSCKTAMSMLTAATLHVLQFCYVFVGEMKSVTKVLMETCGLVVFRSTQVT